MPERPPPAAGLRRPGPGRGAGGLGGRPARGWTSCGRRLAKQVADKQAAARRLAADVDGGRRRAGAGVRDARGQRRLGRREVDALNREPGRGGRRAGGRSTRSARPGGCAAGWPPAGRCWPGWPSSSPTRCAGCISTGWAPARKRKEIDPSAVGRTSLPADLGRPAGPGRLRRAGPGRRRPSTGLSRGWADAIKRAARSGETDALPDRLDRAVAGTDLDLAQHRRWWQLVRVLQWLLVAAVVAGLGWLGLGLRAGLSAAAAAARGHLVGSPGADRAGGRRRRWPGCCWPGWPGSGSRSAPGAGPAAARQLLRSAIGRGHRRAGRRTRSGPSSTATSEASARALAREPRG